ncbi:MAG: Vi polysaccharide biosynthesis protein vipB/tviC [Parcubacteria group bacterium Gr01-1014_48]|nr:MAG: Vi polysaccharide biosynthesis protein vipB/tviC [Parcubacteria group bacterium Greene0416_14]TSC72058.1 MAG: Vi polysaccharide biosynthesis protein vipB/tviC [Parcubacteria group bacterium Gr01-1014_48]TSC99831.1 MAG: Vi polysaccharide biosynthesis protein vipB/tviC [Parcubacteria group bacterium Greene1014_15]TSD07150.1 MAG: Vi polysaccharide biosynthesis protein vipB/tviC [Parcubacteria group bacterium Greene0714_4]
MKAVVTGGAGFIGSHLTDALVEKGFDVQVIDDLSQGKKENVNPKATLHVASICDYETIAPIVKGADYVFHLAALPRVQYSIEHPRETSEINVTGTLNVLIAAKEAGVKRVIYSASSSAYGDTDAMPLREDMPANPISPYALQKYIGELNCRLFSAIYGLSTVSLRYFNVYGSRQDPTGPYALVIGRFLLLKKERKPLLITGDGTQTRDFTHVRDVVRANLLAMESKNVGNGEVINIGAGKNRSINEIAKYIGGSIEYIEKRIEPHDTLADISLAKKLLDWEPMVPFNDGIKELL